MGRTFGAICCNNCTCRSVRYKKQNGVSLQGAYFVRPLVVFSSAGFDILIWNLEESRCHALLHEHIGKFVKVLS